MPPSCDPTLTSLRETNDGDGREYEKEKDEGKEVRRTNRSLHAEGVYDVLIFEPTPTSLPRLHTERTTEQEEGGGGNDGLRG
ncbi:hypothetical protein GALMADRAFT_146558 [Galerina marginata CBS 339.88]|uniref:Uncharacterized protein n=1 Tax=Galerina marginata (strain CBS 339.88) TaxID=685588 RepID=A0A067SK28_GALM3|nr:hypothetical protein GALMADRAFT_146558 [Galerina marginata CBS 339.88]